MSISKQPPQLIVAGWNHGYVRYITRQEDPKDLLRFTIEDFSGRVIKTYAGENRVCLLYEDGTKDVI
jgi:hypothetical protein